MSTDASHMQSTFARRLEEQLRLKRFFSRLLTEVIQLRASRVIFQHSNDQMVVRLLVGDSERKRIKVGEEWFALIIRWLEQRWAPSLHVGSSERTSIIQENSFPVQIREGEHTVQAIAVRADASFRIERIAVHPSRSVTQSLALIGGATVEELETIVKLESGVIVVVSPRVQELTRAVATVLGLSGGFYGGDLNEKMVQKLAFHLGRKELIIVSYEADSIADALYSFEKKVAVDWTDVLSGIVGVSFIPAICAGCATKVEVSTELAHKLPVTLPVASAYCRTAKGCQLCDHQGVRGWELLLQAKRVDETTGDFLQKKPGKALVKEYLSDFNLVSFPEQGLRLVHAGKVSTRTLGSAFAAYQELSAVPGDGITIDENFFTAESSETSTKSLAASQVFSPGVMQHIFSTEDEAAVSGSRGHVKRQEVKILVAEDDSSQRELLELILENEGYVVTAVQNGLEALGLLKSLRPHLIVTDIMMPKLNGTELVAAIKADPELSDIPILVLTVLTDSDREYELLDMGVDDYCEKTVQRKVLLKRIENVLRRFYKIID